MQNQSSGDGADEQSSDRKSRSNAPEVGKSGGRKTPRKKRPSAAPRHKPKAAGHGDELPADGRLDPDEYQEFMEKYGTASSGDLASSTASSGKAEPKTLPRRRLGNVSQTALGLLIQGCSLSACIALVLLILILWTLGHLEANAERLAWVVVFLGGATTLAGEGMCLTIPTESRTRGILIAALVCTGLAAVGLATDYFAPAKDPTIAQLVDLGNIVMFTARMCLLSLFLSRVATWAGESVYETRSVFVLVGTPLAIAVAFGYLTYAPQMTDEAGLSTRTIITGIRWWIVMTVVAVAVMYISILLGMGRALRRRGTSGTAKAV